MEPVSEPEIPAVRSIQPLDRIAAFVEVLLCSGFPTQLLIIGLLMNAGMRMQTPDGRLSPSFIFTLSLVDAVLVVGLVFFFLLAHRESPRGILLGQRPVGREMLMGIALVPICFVIVMVVLLLILSVAPGLRNVPHNPLEDMMQTPGNAVIFGIVAMIAGGVREEIQRAFIVHRFEGFLGGALVGVVVYSTLFGLGHLEQGKDAAIATGTLGLIWGVTYMIRRSVVAPMVSHAAFNLANVIKFVALR